MTLKVKVTFVVSLTLFMTPKGQGVIRGQRDLYDPKGQPDLWPWPKVKHLTQGKAFDPACDHKCPGKTIMRKGSLGVPYFSLCRFIMFILAMLTIALHRVIWSNGHISKTTEPILKIFAATDSATMVSG